MRGTRTKKQGETADEPEQSADQSQKEEKISLWLIIKNRWPWLSIIYGLLVLTGIYALMTQPIQLNYILVSVFIVALYKFFDKLIIKWFLKRRGPRNDKR